MRRITISMLAVAAAMFAVGSPVMAASCNGNGHQVVLSNGRATPGTGTTSTVTTFSVRYADTAGCAPDRVVVVVQGLGTYPLSGSGSDYSAGVTFSRSLRLPAGSHPYSFKATSGKKAAALSNVAPSAVTIAAPTPRPEPTPAPAMPTPKPKPAPTVQPAPAAPAPRPPASRPPRPSPTATAAPTASPSGAPTADATGSPAALGVIAPSATAIDGWWSARHGLTDPSGSGGGTTRTPVAAIEFAPDFPPSLDALGPLGVLGSFGLATAGGLALFFVLLRTRRGSTMAPPPLITASIPSALATAVASPAPAQTPMTPAPLPDAGERAGTPRVSPLPPMRELIPPIDYDLLRDPDERVGPAANEENIPRWLRPSVRAGRYGEEPTRRRDWGD